MPLSREATADAYAKHRALHNAGRWPDLADLFAEDAQYADPFFGRIQGREAIRDFLVRSMTGLEDWTFPIQWTAIDAGRVITHWYNRLPGQRRDGGFFQFPGMSTISYNDDGFIIEQMDMYDRVTALQVIGEGKSRVIESALGGVKALGEPLVMGIHRLVAKR